MVDLFGEKSLPAAETEADVKVGELGSALGFDLGEEVPQPGEEEDGIGEEDEEEEEPL